MAAAFALSWTRPPAWAERLNKPPGRGVSPYRSSKFDDVERTAQHINELAPEFDCKVEVFTS